MVDESIDKASRGSPKDRQAQAGLPNWVSGSGGPRNGSVVTLSPCVLARLAVMGEEALGRPASGQGQGGSCMAAPSGSVPAQLGTLGDKFPLHSPVPSAMQPSRGGRCSGAPGEWGHWPQGSGRPYLGSGSENRATLTTCTQHGAQAGPDSPPEASGWS